MSFQIALWFAKDQASIARGKPWHVKNAEGVWACQHVDFDRGITSFKDTGHMELPGGPRGVVYVDHVQMIGAEPVNGP